MNYIEQLQAMSENEQFDAIEAKIIDACHDLVASDEFDRAAGGTNAVDWAVDEWDVVDIDLDEDECVVQLTYAATGEQLEDSFFAGDRIDGEAKAVIDAAGNVSFEEVTASVSDSKDWEGDGQEDEDV